MHTLPSEFLVLFLLAVAVLISNLVSRALRISPMATYLWVGIVGFYALPDLFQQLDRVSIIGHMGVLLMLFTLGLETPLRRLLALKRYILLLGLGQTILVTAFVTSFCMFFGLSIMQALYIAVTLSFASTALTLTFVVEQKQMHTLLGKGCLSVLLFQDFAAVFLFVLLSAMKQSGGNLSGVSFTTFLPPLLGVAVLFFGNYLMRFVIEKGLTKTPSHEKTWALVLTSMLGYSIIGVMFHLGFEISAFIAGMLWAETTLRHHFEHEIYGISRILLAFFFIQISGRFDFSFFAHHWPVVIVFAVILNTLKWATMTLVSRMCSAPWYQSAYMGLLLSGCGEFAVLFFSHETLQAFLGQWVSSLCFAIAIVSIFSTPLWFWMGSRALRMFFGSPYPICSQISCETKSECIKALPQN